MIERLENLLIKILKKSPQWMLKGKVGSLIVKIRKKQSVRSDIRKAERAIQEAKDDATFERNMKALIELYPDPQKAKVEIKKFMDHWESRKN